MNKPTAEQAGKQERDAIVKFMRDFADFEEGQIVNLGSVESAMSMGGVAFLRKSADVIETRAHLEGGE